MCLCNKCYNINWCFFYKIYVYVLKILILIEIRGIVMIWNDYDVKLGL